MTSLYEKRGSFVVRTDHKVVVKAKQSGTYSGIKLTLVLTLVLKDLCMFMTYKKRTTNAI